MKFRSAVPLLAGLIAGSWVFSPMAAFSQSRPIRLRNETILTDSPVQSLAAGRSTAAAATPAKPSGPVSGLFLVQFNDHLQKEWRAELEALGVELLRYVPEDAFIARFSNADADRVRALGYVHWVGDFRPEHKLHGQLLQQAQAASLRNSTVNNAVEISILTTPRANRFEVAELRRLLTLTKQESRLRQGTVLRGTIMPGQLTALAQMRTVLWVEPAPKIKLFDEAASKIVGGDDGLDGTPTLTQQMGFSGAGVTVSVADTGLNNGDVSTMHPDLFGRVDGFLFYGSLTDAADEHGHGTHVAGIIAGNAATGEANDFGDLFGLGVASQAHIFSQRIFDADGNFEAPPSNETLTRDAVRNGAVIGSNSWGDDTQGRYDISAAEFDELVRDADGLAFGDQPYILEFSAGNAGPGAQTIGSPAVGKNVIATGASQNNFSDLFIYEDGQEAMADFSSRGPAEDGRIKPDVVAPGTWIASLQSASATSDNAWEPIDEFYQYEGGTSQAGPHVSGAAAVFVQYYRSQHTNATPSPALVKAALINSAVNMNDDSGTGPIPNMDEGWGRVDLTQIIGSPKHFEYVDQTDLLITGQVYEHHTFVASSQQPLKITMTYTDVPGFPGAIPALVNNLDLEVVGPNGTLYLGNQMENGESVPNATAADGLNNVEEVYLSTPVPGDYTVRVRARNVVDDARSDTAAVDQDFALVIGGDIPPANLGIVTLDRGAYTAPDRIGIQVRDLDQAGHASASVLLHSTTESKESILLLPAAGPGIFTNSVQTVVGAPVADGKLQIHHGDVILALYVDVSAGVTRTAHAVADLLPPVITNVQVTNQLNQMVIMWTTDEPSRSIVRYSTNLSFSLSATNNELTTSHSVSIVNFKGGATYNFIVISSDEAGNTATNNNGGAFTFVGVPPATALLVDAYVPDADSTVIPVSTYTDALTAAGISFNVWNVTQHTNSSAPLSTLKAFPVVIWRVSDSLYTDSPNSTLSSSDQNNLTTYVNSGGSFFMSSMETLSRIGDVPFRKNILQVASFTTNPDPFSVCTDCDEDVGVPSIQGTGNDPVSSGVNTILDYSNYPELDLLGTIIGPDLSDTFTPTTNAVTILRDPSSGKNVGIRFPRTGSDSPGRVVFCAFPFDTIPAAGASPNNRANIMRNIISFLAPGANGLGTITLDNATYTVPGLVTVEVGDSDLAGLGQATANFTSTTQTNPVTITLKETVRPGLFRGFVSLIPTNATAGPGQLRAKNGDAIVARYFDASANGTVQVAATVDTIPVTISVVSVEPGYQDAVVSWTTSDPADSLVQYGESVLLGRTAYAGDFDIDHEVTLQGLLTDHDYYFKVVSHDEAGNTTVDDNQGQLYTFHTLLPKRPPFMDDMEHGPTNWTVIDADGTEVSWTLGKPDNGLETNGHSPTNAWGSNLHGESTGSVESYLVSPAIELVGGNNAVLQFWHSYDFTPLSDSDLLEYGEVLVLTNTTSDPVVLATFDQFSDGYEPVTLDLTPYLGKVVYLAWHYLEFSLQNAPRPGWLVDDVSVTVSNAPVGTVVVTNNLAAGLFAISGPMNRNGSGMQTTISNAPPGQYVIQFGGVAYYQTPANQTNTLTAGTTLTFTGNYTFVDANHNGIPDSWETQYFGTVSSNRTAFTDTDGDGMTDRAEFIAGTDPTNAASKLSFIMPFNQVSNVIQMQWSAVPGRLYRLESSTNMTSWTPMSGWLPGSSSSMSYTVTNQPPDRARLFRVRVQN